MRRTIPLVVAVLTLAVVFAAPTMAAPDRNPDAETWLLDCEGMAPFVAMSPFIPPGWVEVAEGEYGGVPVNLMGGTWTVYEYNVETGTFTDPVPPGLMPKLTPCEITGPLEANPSVFRLEGDVFLLFPSR